MSVHEQFFILNKAHCDLVQMRENVVKMNRQNFRFLNRLLSSWESPAVKSMQKTGSHHAIKKDHHKVGLKALEEKKRYLTENKMLYKKLFEGRPRPEIIDESWTRHLKAQKNILSQKQKERDLCRREIQEGNKYERQVLDKYNRRVEVIKNRRKVEITKEDFKNARGFQLVDCKDFINTVRKLSDFDLESSLLDADGSEQVCPPCPCDLKIEKSVSEVGETDVQIAKNTSSSFLTDFNDLDMSNSDLANSEPELSGSTDSWTPSSSYGAASFVAIKSIYRNFNASPTRDGKRGDNDRKTISRSAKVKVNRCETKGRAQRMRGRLEAEIRKDLAKEMRRNPAQGAAGSSDGSEFDEKKIQELEDCLMRERESIRRIYGCLAEGCGMVRD